MKTIIYSLIIAVSVFCSGCGDKKANGDKQPTATATPTPKTPTVNEYRAVLEKWKASVDGADIDIQKLCDEFQNANDDDKRKRYDAVKAQVHD